MDIKYSLLFLCFILSHAEAGSVDVAADKPTRQSSLRIGSGSSDSPDSPAWYSVDLLSRYFIRTVYMHVEVFKGGAGVSPYFVNVIVLNSFDGEAESLVPEFENTCGKLRIHFQWAMRKNLECVRLENTFRYIVLVTPYPNQLKVSVLEVWTERVDIAFGRPARQSTTEATLVADNAVDKDDTTHSLTSKPTHSYDENLPLPWLSVDLGHSYHVEKMVVYYEVHEGFSTWSSRSPRSSFEMKFLLLSDFNPNTATSKALCASAPLSEFRYTLELACPNEGDKYQFVGVEIPNMYQLAVYDFQVYASKRNLAFERPAIQSSQSDHHEAKFAVDRDEETFSLSLFTHSNHSAYLMVDLGERYYIEGVEVTLQISTDASLKHGPGARNPTLPGPSSLLDRVLNVLLANPQRHALCSSRLISTDYKLKEFVVCDRILETFQQVILVFYGTDDMKVYDLKVYQGASPIEETLTEIVPGSPGNILIRVSAATKLHAFCGKLVCFVIFCYYAGFSSSP